MTKKILEMHYTTIQTLQEVEVLPRFLSSLQGKFTEVAATGHKINCSVNPEKKQITALFDGGIKIIANITDHNVRLVSFTKIPELMKIYESAKKKLEEEYATREALSTLEPIMHIHSCTVEIYPDSSMNGKYEYAAKKLIDRITRNKTIIMLR